MSILIKKNDVFVYAGYPLLPIGNVEIYGLSLRYGMVVFYLRESDEAKKLAELIRRSDGFDYIEIKESDTGGWEVKCIDGPK